MASNRIRRRASSNPATGASKLVEHDAYANGMQKNVFDVVR
jgi:hypothetical protein